MVAFACVLVHFLTGEPSWSTALRPRLQKQVAYRCSPDKNQVEQLRCLSTKQWMFSPKRKSSRQHRLLTCLILNLTWHLALA
mmetsp:Transcript_4243/g.27054  ORF Transcript_4243/g.27054 Transcript_4243/m.27054 type:complete len:82 (+) Transcript_4243:1538-1783(+)